MKLFKVTVERSGEYNGDYYTFAETPAGAKESVKSLALQYGIYLKITDVNFVSIDNFTIIRGERVL